MAGVEVESDVLGESRVCVSGCRDEDLFFDGCWVEGEDGEGEGGLSEFFVMDGLLKTYRDWRLCGEREFAARKPESFVELQQGIGSLD